MLTLSFGSDARTTIRSPRHVLVRHAVLLTGVLLILVATAGCSGSNEATSDSGKVTRTFDYDADLYRVELEQREWNGRCVERRALFTTYSRLYSEPHVNRVRAVDSGCDATYVTGFEDLQIMRSPEQEERYINDFSFRQRVNEGLWDAYEEALFNSRWRN